MTKVIVAYDTKYGNTKIAAEKIIEGMKEVDPNKIIDFDAILIGSPNHFGGPTRTAKKFIDKLGKVDLKETKIALFDIY